MPKACFYKISRLTAWFALISAGCLGTPKAYAARDLSAALRRAQYLLNGTYPTDAEIAAGTASDSSYRATVDKSLWRFSRLIAVIPLISAKKNRSR